MDLTELKERCVRRRVNISSSKVIEKVLEETYQDIEKIEAEIRQELEKFPKRFSPKDLPFDFSKATWKFDSYGWEIDLSFLERIFKWKAEFEKKILGEKEE